MESLTRPFFHHRRKLSNLNSSNSGSSNGLSFSGSNNNNKDAYDDVLLASSAPKSKKLGGGATVVVEDYGEIFGGRRRVSSSIPVLDLSDLDKRGNNVLSSNTKLDYSKIFGSFAAEDDDVALTAVPPYEELFGGSKKAKKCDKVKARTPADKKGLERLNSSEYDRGFSSEASDQSLDGGKQMNVSYHKFSQPSKDGSNGTTHIAELHAVPGFTFLVDEAARSKTNKHDKPFPQVKSDANHSRSLSGGLGEGKSSSSLSGDLGEGKSRRAKWQLPERQASEGLIKGKDNSSRGEVHLSARKLFHSGEFDLKSYPSKVPMPSNSSANLDDYQGHPKRAKSSSFGSKAEAPEKDFNGYLSSSSDEELDVNSTAAISAATLKKAIQQAQESIRIAKEIMERKKDSVKNSKSRANGSLKVIDGEEMKHTQDMSGVRKKETPNTINREALAFSGFDHLNARGSNEVASAFTCRENVSVDREVDVAKHEESAEVTEEQRVGTWFTQLLNTGKNKMAAFTSQLVDNRNTIFQPTSKHLHDTEETAPAEDSLEMDTAEPVDIDGKLDALGKAPDLEKNLESSVSDQSVRGTGGIILTMEARKKKATEVEKGSHRQEKCEKKLQVCDETTYDGQFEPEILEICRPANELSNTVEIKKEEEKSFKVELGKKLDDVLMWQENLSRLYEKDNWRRQEGSSMRKDVEHEPKEDTATESSEKKQEDSKDKEFSGNRLQGGQQDTDEQRSTRCLDGVENQNISEQEIICEGIDQRSTRTYQHESTAVRDAGDDNSIESEKIEANLHLQEGDTTKEETDQNVENPRAGLFPDAVNEENLNACSCGESTLLGRAPEDSEVNNTSNQTRQVEVTDLEENDNHTEFTELESVGTSGSVEFEEDKEEAEQAVDAATQLKENEMFETYSREHVLESVIENVSEALSSDDNIKNFGFDTTINEELSTVTNLLKRTDLTTNEHAVEGTNATEEPPAGEKTSDCEFSEMNGQEEIKESDEGSEFSVGPENGDDLVHESGDDSENSKENSVASDREVEKHNSDADNKEKDCVEEQLEQECSRLSSETKESEEPSETDTEMRANRGTENHAENICKTSVKEEKENRERMQKVGREKDLVKKIEVDQREREREKDRIAVERAIREARERAFTEARERAERTAVEKATAEVRQRAMAGAREKLEKVSAGTKVSTDRATTEEAKLKAERAAVERATAEARERALEKALTQKSTSHTRVQVEKVVAGKSATGSRDTGLKHSFSSSDLEGTYSESAQRRKARLERHQRIMERAAKALAEKNMRDILAQREQAERNRLAETLDADIKRWASGKEGNLRALLSTLQYILGADSGWQPISLTEIITTTAVKKAYRKATLYVHPDKLQQRGASIQQKYICEKVFDLLKAAWNRFNSEER